MHEFKRTNSNLPFLGNFRLCSSKRRQPARHPDFTCLSILNMKNPRVKPSLDKAVRGLEDRRLFPTHWRLAQEESGGDALWCDEVSRIEVSHQTDIVAVVHGCSSLHHSPHIVRGVQFQDLLGDDLMTPCSHERKCVSNGGPRSNFQGKTVS